MNPTTDADNVAACPKLSSSCRQHASTEEQRNYIHCTSKITSTTEIIILLYPRVRQVKGDSDLPTSISSRKLASNCRAWTLTPSSPSSFSTPQEWGVEKENASSSLYWLLLSCLSSPDYAQAVREEE